MLTKAMNISECVHEGSGDFYGSAERSPYHFPSVQPYLHERGGL